MFQTAVPGSGSRSGDSSDISRLLPLVRQAVSPEIASLKSDTLKPGGFIAEVLRLSPRRGDGRDDLPGLVVKIVHTSEQDGSFLQDRECNFYSAVHPQLDLPQPRVYFAGSLRETRERVVIMEDLAGYRTPPRTHRWTMPEAACFARAYARLHAPAAFQPEGAAGWLFNIRAGDFTSRDVLTLACEITSAGAWPALPGLADLLDWTIDAASGIEGRGESFLHGDVFPPNIALPSDLSGDAVLIDWDMAGIGPAEMDLAFMFLQPFGSAADLDRQSVLDIYWAERTRLAAEKPVPDDRSRPVAEIPPPADRAHRQRFADALWGLYLIRVAHRSVFDPFEPGSPSDVYWQGMREVLYRWFADLLMR